MNDDIDRLPCFINRLLEIFDFLFEPYARWDMTASTVNAYYSPTHNQIVFPAGILQEPFFSVNYSQSVNFGGIGAIMGHELSHAFDDTGREHDKYGNLNQWWNNKTIDAFNKAAQCIVDQYSAYKINGENINGKRTLGWHLGIISTGKKKSITNWDRFGFYFRGEYS